MSRAAAAVLVCLGLALQWTGTAVGEARNFLLAGLVFAVLDHRSRA